MKKLALLGAVLLGLLFFMFPVPGTVSLRDLLLLLVLLVFGYLAWRNGRWRDPPRALIVPATLLALLTAWMYGVAFFVSPETAWSLGEINSQWLRGLLALLGGVLVSVSLRSDAVALQRVLLMIVIALTLHVAYVDLEAVYFWTSGWDFERLAGLAGGPDKSNYITNMLFCFLFAELVYRFANKKKALPVNNMILGSVLAVTLASVFVERTRNGIMVLALLLLATGLLSLFAMRTRLRKTVLVTAAVALLFIIIGGLGVANSIKPLASDFRNLAASVSIAWDTERYTAWRNDKQAAPVLPSGETIDTSIYQRIAWFKEGLLIVTEHPWGIGFGRNAFGHGLKAKYGEGAGHSHSGLLDLAIGTGVPGVVLWLGFLAGLGHVAWKQYRQAPSFAALLLLLLSLDFGARMVVDSVIRDHMLQQFMLLAGFAAVLAVAPAKRKPSA